MLNFICLFNSELAPRHAYGCALGVPPGVKCDWQLALLLMMMLLLLFSCSLASSQWNALAVLYQQLFYGNLYCVWEAFQQEL